MLWGENELLEMYWGAFGVFCTIDFFPMFLLDSINNSVYMNIYKSIVFIIFEKHRFVWNSENMFSVIVGSN